MLELSSLTLACCLIRKVDTRHIVWYRESLLPALFIAGGMLPAESYFQRL
jgi:hypothetical protein